MQNMILEKLLNNKKRKKYNQWQLRKMINPSIVKSKFHHLKTLKIKPKINLIKEVAPKLPLKT
jgi:hypothetical protein